MVVPKWLFPALTIALNLGSAAVCAGHGDWRRSVYWLAAAVLTCSVTF
jgi:hypothetical protein